MKAIAPLVLLVGATACGASLPAATTPSGSPSTHDAVGVTNAQGSDDPNRALTKDECEDLGAWMTQVCRTDYSRQARIEGWCSDVSTRTASVSWMTECAKSIKYMDAVCFRSTDNPSAMMTCDRTFGR
jgi:hypothetical protein